MRLLIIFVGLTFLFTSCDKETSVAKKLLGEWDLVAFKITLQNGINQYPESHGDLIITEGNNAPLDFSSTHHYTLLGTEIVESKSGFMQLKDNGNYLDVTLLDENDLELGLEAHRIMVLTKTDLQLEYTDSEGRLRNLTYKKK
jgi:hypothetical protein